MLLTFFSRAGENYGVDDTEVGNTEVIAGYIKDYFGDKIDVFKLEPVNPYPDAYQECTEIAKPLVLTLASDSFSLIASYEPAVPEPAWVLNGMIVLPAKSYLSKKVLMIIGGSPHQIG